LSNQRWGVIFWVITGFFVIFVRLLLSAAFPRASFSSLWQGS
jgi:hypothetical protein